VQGAAVRVVIPLPAADFDPTEVSVPWSILRAEGYEVVFSTPLGQPARADVRMLDGRGLLFWAPVLRARREARELHDEMIRSPEFLSPLPWSQLAQLKADGLILPGGHAPGMKPYLESPEVQGLALRFFSERRPVAAICHGVVVLARAVDSDTGRSVLFGRRSTCLTRPMEMSAWSMTALWLGRYYRTYTQTVEEEVCAAQGEGDPGGPPLFSRGPFALFRDGPAVTNRGYTVRDGQYLSARWPGDTYAFSRDFVEMLEDRR
jgi:putative intracellular protease/amidase